MNNLLRFVFLAAIMIAAISLPAACTCTDTTFAARKAQATHIFEGKVVRVESNWMSGGMKYTFAVARTWGTDSDHILVINTPFDRDCGYHFEEGRTYLVYATRKFTLKTFFCSGNALIGQAGADLARLGPGNTTHASLLAPKVMWLVGLMGALATLFVGLVVTRKFWRKK